jgi:hypothetical protein
MMPKTELLFNFQSLARLTAALLFQQKSSCSEINCSINKHSVNSGRSHSITSSIA